MAWPFRRKAKAPEAATLAPAARKSATFFLTLGRGKAGLTGADYDRLAAEGYGENVVAFACINLIATASSSVDWQLYRRGKGGKLAKVESHALLDLIENPNSAQSGREFVQGLISQHRLSGNAYVYGNGMDPMRRKSPPPAELQLLSPGKIQIKPGEGFLPRLYEYKPDPSRRIEFPVDQVSGRSSVLHLKTFNPLNPWYGMSPLEAAALGVDIHNDGQKWNKRLIENGARPSGALVVKAADGQSATITDEQYQRLQEMIDSQFSGPGNAGRPMLLEGGLDWKEMSINPKDMEFLEGKHSAARDIALAFGVPPMLLGIPGDATYSNMAEAELALWARTVLPLLGQVLDAFNRWLTPLYGEDLYLWYDEEMIPALEPLRKQKAERIANAQYMTVNEKRRAMGLDDVNGGDVVLVGYNTIPLGLIDASVMLQAAESGSLADQSGQPEDDPETEKP